MPDIYNYGLYGWSWDDADAEFIKLNNEIIEIEILEQELFPKLFRLNYKITSNPFLKLI